MQSSRTSTACGGPADRVAEDHGGGECTLPRVAAKWSSTLRAKLRSRRAGLFQVQNAAVS